MLPLQARVDLVAKAINGYSAFPKAPLVLKRFGGARSVMVIIVENGHGDTCSNP